MSPDEQEARSRRYANERIILLPLKSGNIAIFNNGGDLCGIGGNPAHGCHIWNDIQAYWYPPAAVAAKPKPTLEELFNDC